jgi:hypothetical protein
MTREPSVIRKTAILAGGSIPKKNPPPKRKWYQRPFIYGPIAAVGLIAGIMLSLRDCGESKPVPQVVQQECKVCPDGQKEKKYKTKFGSITECHKPLADPICGNKECEDGAEYPKDKREDARCEKDCPAVCGDTFKTHEEHCDPKSGEKNKGCEKGKRCDKKTCKCKERKQAKPEPKCGDKNCDPNENANTCSADCSAVCGDTFKTHSEPCDTKLAAANKGCSEDKVCKNKKGVCACVKKPVQPPSDCSPKSASSISFGASGKFGLLRKVVGGVHAFKNAIKGQSTVNVGIIICPNGKARVYSVDIKDRVLKKQVLNSVNNRLRQPVKVPPTGGAVTFTIPVPL